MQRSTDWPTRLMCAQPVESAVGRGVGAENGDLFPESLLWLQSTEKARISKGKDAGFARHRHIAVVCFTASKRCALFCWTEVGWGGLPDL